MLTSYFDFFNKKYHHSQMSTVRTSRQLATKTAGTAGAAPEQYSKALRWLHLGLGAGVATCFATVNVRPRGERGLGERGEGRARERGHED